MNILLTTSRVVLALLLLMALISGNALADSVPPWQLTYQPTRPNTARPGQMAAAYMIPAHFDLRPNTGLDHAPTLVIRRGSKVVGRLEGALQRSGVWRYVWKDETSLPAGDYQASVTSPQGKAQIHFQHTP